MFPGRGPQGSEKGTTVKGKRSMDNCLFTLDITSEPIIE